eukprot:2298240-Amphidinium_carterae.1
MNSRAKCSHGPKWTAVQLISNCPLSPQTRTLPKQLMCVERKRRLLHCSVDVPQTLQRSRPPVLSGQGAAQDPICAAWLYEELHQPDHQSPPQGWSRLPPTPATEDQWRNPACHHHSYHLAQYCLHCQQQSHPCSHGTPI